MEGIKEGTKYVNRIPSFGSHGWFKTHPPMDSTIRFGSALGSMLSKLAMVCWETPRGAAPRLRAQAQSAHGPVEHYLNHRHCLPEG